MFEIRRRSLRELAQQKPTYLFSTIIAAMGYAKSVGKEPGDFVRFFMERQRGWERLRGDIEGVFQTFVANFQQHTPMVDDEFKVIVHEHGVSLVTPPIDELFAEEVALWGLTPEEVRRGWSASAPVISRYTGFHIVYDVFDGKHWIHILKPRARSEGEEASPVGGAL